MTPDEYQEMNDVLVSQATENEILMEGMAERIRDLEAEVARLKALRSMPLSSTNKDYISATQLREWD